MEEGATREQTHREAQAPTVEVELTNKEATSNRNAPRPGSVITHPHPAVAPGVTARTLRVAMGRVDTSTMAASSSRVTTVEEGEEGARLVTAPGSGSSDKCVNSMLSNLPMYGLSMIRTVRPFFPRGGSCLRICFTYDRAI